MAKAITTPVIPDNGKAAFLALWLLLTTNKNFLLVPAEEAVNTDLANKKDLGTTPVAWTTIQGDSIKSMGALVNMLQKNNASSDNFTLSKINNLLTARLQTTFLTNENGTQGQSFAKALKDVCDIFNSLQVDFVPAWTPPCPRTMCEALKVANQLCN